MRRLFGAWEPVRKGPIDIGVRDRVPGPFFRMLLGLAHVNGSSRAIASKNGGSISYIFPLILGVLQRSHH